METGMTGVVYAIAFSVVAVVSITAAVIAFWPEKVFKNSDLTWWRRGALTIALYWLLGVAGMLSAWGNKPTPGEVSVHSVLYLLGRATILLLPLIFLRKLRKAVDLRVRWNWIALIFMIPILIEPSLVTATEARPWGDHALILLHLMLIGFTEELAFRGYAFQLHPLHRPKATIIVTSALFTLFHFAQYSQSSEFPFLCARAFLLGIGLGVVRLATGSIGLAALIHGMLNFVIQNDIPAHQPAWMALGVAALVALFLHPSCRRVPEPALGELSASDLQHS